MNRKFKNRAALTVGTLLVSLLFQCHSLTDIKGGQELEGWRVEEENGNPVDVFYMRIGGRASERAVEKSDPIMMKSTCVESTTLQAQDKIIRKMLGEEVKASSSTIDGELEKYIVQSVRKGLIRGTSMKECASVSGSSWLNCECIHYVKGRNLKKDFELTVQNAH